MRTKLPQINLLSSKHKNIFLTLIESAPPLNEPNAAYINFSYFLTLGVGIEGTDENNKTALQLAAEKGTFAAIHILMGLSLFDITQKTPRGYTLLHLLSRNIKLTESHMTLLMEK